MAGVNGEMQRLNCILRVFVRTYKELIFIVFSITLADLWDCAGDQMYSSTQGRSGEPHYDLRGRALTEGLSPPVLMRRSATDTKGTGLLSSGISQAGSAVKNEVIQLTPPARLD